MREGEQVIDAPMAETVVRPALPVDLGLTLGLLRRGRGDPTMRAEPGGVWWRATRTPQGAATLRLAPDTDGVVVAAWGPGAEWAAAAAPGLLGAADDLDGFAPDGLVGDLHQRLPGLRVPRSGAVLEALVPSILEQKVMQVEAFASYRGIVRRWGTPAPGPAGLLVPPTAAVLRAQPAWAFHPLGVEGKRANAVRVAASYGRRLEALTALPPAEAQRRLRSLPGVGPWTAAEVAGVALGDADAVPVGDYHLPHLVSWALLGERRGTDEQMLELLEPYAGHRGRVLRLLAAAGLYPPRRGPRLPLRRLQRH